RSQGQWPSAVCRVGSLSGTWHPPPSVLALRRLRNLRGTLRQPDLRGPCRELGSVGELQLHQRVPHVRLNRSLGQNEMTSDVPVRSSLGHQSDDLSLAPGQRRGWFLCPPSQRI